ncbi:hypothetical protein [Verrucosispora sp. WMMD1129]|uniref:hypothetical protein n=1 Tax=Verrucosispora sp. WMMD1129 TaxID=3016093 RepID=UPI00249C99DF|nr:hypothetical protein [Verrucosispora sp. WMMD1129]WFE46801.1 hypothetical protein O7624_21870 [Verrucosispora sp. WMMD1129]
MLTGPNLRAEIIDVQRPVKNLIAFTVRILDGSLAVGDAVYATVDPEWRTGARQAHSGTHVVHAALRHVLGPNALQSGSYNRPGYLCLDFAWRGGLSEATTARSRRSRTSRSVATCLSTSATCPWNRPAPRVPWPCSARPTTRPVRVVEFGGEWSCELCGGTHVDHSAQIGSPSRVSRTCSSPTNPPPHSMSLCRHNCSTCWPGSATN